MNSIKLLRVLIFHLFTRTCFAGIGIDTSESNGSADLVKAAIKMLTSCYGSRVTEIGIAGNSSDSLISTLSVGESFSTVLFDNGKRSVNTGPVIRISRYKLQLFVIVASSSMELEEILVNIKNSRWWNHMAQFYILDGSAKKQGCSRAYEILWTAWKMDVLEAKFMCTNNERLIYGFNPYTENAPKPWKLEKIYRGLNDHRWALLVQEFRENSEICDTIDFDKTHDLAGSKIRCSVKPKTWYIDVNPNNTGIDVFSGPKGNILRSLFSTLNATPELLIHNQTERIHLESVIDEGKASGILAETVNGISDIALIRFDNRYLAKVTSSYPHSTNGRFILTQYRGYKSQLSKIAAVIDKSSRICLGIVILLTIIFLKFSLRETLPIAILDTLRLICNSCLPKLPLKLGPRLYLTGLFIFVITIQALYQGQLASLLAKQIHLSDINNLDDLAESDHKIYGNYAFKGIFDKREFAGRFFGINEYNCTEFVLRDNLAACVRSWSQLVPDAAQFKLHLSSDKIESIATTWLIRDNWPLERRINVIIQRLVEAHVFEHERKKKFEEPLRRIDGNNNENKDRSRKILSLSDLSFAFVILGIGFICATICCIVEIAISRNYRLRNTIYIRVNFRHRRT